MLEYILLLEQWNGVNAGQHSQVSADVADSLVSSGKAKRIETEKQTKSETKKVGK